jgi:hypothetical protein
MSQEETIEILQELLKSIKTRGFKKTLNLLKSTSESAPITDPFDNHVIDLICEYFEVDKNDLFQSKYMRGEMKYAVGMCVYFMYKNKSIGEIHKRIFPHKNKTLLSKYRQLIFELDPDFEQDVKVLRILNHIDTKIESFKKDNQ